VSVDFRTRCDEDVVAVDPRRLFASELPAALEASRARIAPGAERLRLRPFSVESEGEVWSLLWEEGRVRVQPGRVAEAAWLRLSGAELTELVRDQRTPMTFFTAGTLDMPVGGLPDFLDWWLVLRAALDGRPLHTPGAIHFRDRDGTGLDLGRAFRPDDPPEELSHFLHEAGFLHLVGVFDEAQMAAISADMDRAAPGYREGDGRSWWATTSDGTRRLVRMQGFDERSTATAELLRDERFLRLAAIPGDGHQHAGLEGNRIEALVKPLGVVEGISDIPWHKDCSLGRHSYECCSLTTGISVTGADASSGQLRVVAGSHRALMWPALIRPGSHDLPEVDLPTGTGDVTLHLSCTLHMAQPPRRRERRVLYTSFRLPGKESPARVAARARLRAVREGAYTTVSQEPSEGAPRSPSEPNGP
jgi:ectoine hydroxylase-related dioxygenase (phytanoyl-CoA dioxygenase family)